MGYEMGWLVELAG